MQAQWRRLTRLLSVAAVVIMMLTACAGSSAITPSSSESEHPMDQGMQHRMETPGASAGTGLVSFTTADFAGASECAWCHTGLSDAAGNDVSIDTAWQATMMANSARDPFWQAKVEAEVASLPDQGRQIQELCARCHMPMAYTQAGTEGSSRTVLEPGFLAANHALHLAAMDGVSCSLCHQISDSLGKGTAGVTGYVIDTSTSPPDRLIHGPYPDPFEMPMREHVGFTPREGPHTTQAELCATCHTVFTPQLSANGELEGQFPEQTPYLEWAFSAYSSRPDAPQPCQSCHMPEADGAVVISSRPRNGRLSARSPFANHDFTGGNTFMAQLVQSQATEIGAPAASEDFESVRERTQTRLERETASIALATRLDNGRLLVDVQISVYAGHKVPSGFPARRVWLHVTVADAAGAVIFESGAPQADGSVAGNDADGTTLAFEPHYDTLSSPDQVQIYEAIMQDSSGLPTYILTQAVTYIKDNRLLPVGFDKLAAPDDIAVHGDAETDATFIGGGDHVTYQIALGRETGPIEVTVELLYQSIGDRFAEELFTAQTPLVTRFRNAYDATPKAPVVLATAQASVEE